MIDLYEGYGLILYCNKCNFSKCFIRNFSPVQQMADSFAEVHWTLGAGRRHVTHGNGRGRTGSIKEILPAFSGKGDGKRTVKLSNNEGRVMRAT